jgi:hypothetical protein
VIVRLKAALSERLVGKITYEGHRGVRDRNCSEFKQQTDLGLPISFAGMPETIISHLVEAFRQYMKKEATEELNTL